MGLFNFIKKKPKENEPKEKLRNFPELLTAQLLFIEKPQIDQENILSELKKLFGSVESLSDGFMYVFPDIKVGEENSSIPAQCTLLFDDNHKIKFDEEAFQQNWHWKDAKQTALNCNYEIILSDFMTKSLGYKDRLSLFMNYLIGVSKATRPSAIYISSSQKMFEPGNLIDSWVGQEKIILHGLVNFRLFNISNSEKEEMIMDTIGLNSLGLPDFQILFSEIEPNKIAHLLWNYANYIYQNGDIIEKGNTLAGIQENSKWKCIKEVSLTKPERIVINVYPG